MNPFEPLPPEFCRRPAAEVARDLLGRYLVRQDGEAERQVLRLVELEAYQGQGDRASHAWRGPVTPRSRRLFRDGGYAYVYLIYGIHLCMNVVTGTRGDGTAVLLRAGSAVAGAPRMAVRRGLTHPVRRGELASGPGRLAQAMGVTAAHDGVPLWDGELVLTAGEPVVDAAVARGPRVGVDYAGEAAAWPLRFALAGHPEVSRPRL